MAACFHCGEPVTEGTDLTVTVGGVARPVCCPGCRAVAALIEARGLARFYAFRTAPSRRPENATIRDEAWSVCDRPDVERRIVRTLASGEKELVCSIDGLSCAACAWLVDRGLRDVAGVTEVTVNPVTHEAMIRFAGAGLLPSAICAAIAALGFVPRPATLDRTGSGAAQAGRAELKRLAVAGLGFAQVMTLSAALYLGAFKNMDASFTGFFTLVSMLVATPVVLYAGAPMLAGAWRDLRRGRLGMDVPVSLAIAVALTASLVNALRGAGAVYFDSATMFVFFLTVGRFLESRARHRAAGVLETLVELKPLCALRESGAGLERVGTIELGVGDRVRVAPGELVPADGALLSERGAFDESLLSGESAGRIRARGEPVLGGSLNVGTAPVAIEVTRVGANSYVERVRGLVDRALADRPDVLGITGRWAAWFVGGVLTLAAGAGAVWLVVAPERAFEVVLATLVVTCPCALSLAAPTAFAVALGSLARRGLLLKSARVLERLGAVDLWLFDKTGTLTRGRVALAEVATYSSLDRDSCLRIAAALEAGIEHPVARAFHGLGASGPPASDVAYRPGFGVEGSVAGRRYRLGSARHVGADIPASLASAVYLADDERLLARIELADTPRAHAREAVATLARGGATLALVSGDDAGAVADAAVRLGIGPYFASQSPDDKLELLESWQRCGRVVAAVGDGINDAPLLARADVSVAMVEGSRLAQAAADVVFTGDDLRVLARLPAWAELTCRTVRLNLTWALLYNAAAVPLAMLGLLTPWLAALGMSLSSLVVVGNALRLGRRIEVAEHPTRGHAQPGLIEQEAA